MKSIFLLVFLIGCAAVPPDVPVFENLQQRLSTDPATGHLLLTPDPICMAKIQETECGHGVYIMSGKEVFVGENTVLMPSKKKWSQLKAEAILIPAVESYAPLVAYIINSCKQNNCNDQVDAFKVKLDSLNGVSTVIQQDLQTKKPH